MGNGYSNHYGSVEKKFFDMTATEAPIAVNAQFVDIAGDGPVATSTTLVDIPQGTGESERIGRKCTITKLLARLNFEFDTATFANQSAGSFEAHETIRIMFVWDKQCNGALANVIEINTDNNYNAFRELSNTKRFHILYDRTFVWNTTATSAGTTSFESTVTRKEYQIRVNKKVFIPIEFDGTTGALAEIKSNNIGLIIWAKHGGRINLLDGRIRLRFIDF